jgi:hypothetical protein
MMISQPPSTRLARRGLFWFCVTIFVSYLTPTSAHEAIDNTPSALLVTAFFDQVVEITFPAAQGSGFSLHAEPDSNTQDKSVPAGDETQAEAVGRQQERNARKNALRQVLSRSIDASAIAHFILGRYAGSAASKDPANQAATLPARSPADGLLDFAAEAIAKMGTKSSSPKSRDPFLRPTLGILDMTIRRDQHRFVSSELTLPNGRVLPLIWEIALRPDGLKIEDVECYGISVRLLLRSAVAQAAAEDPDHVSDLGALLGTGGALGGASHLQVVP